MMSTMVVNETSITTHSTTTGSGTGSGNTTDGSNSKLAPSELFFQYRVNKDSVFQNNEDFEALLQNGLSALASQRDLFEVWQEKTNGELCDWIWQSISNPAATDNEGIPVNQKFVPHTVEYEWWMGTQFLAQTLPKLSPFEIHSVATQSSVFTEGSQSHLALCLLLSVYALRQCPSPIEQRWKRWQSLTCETIRLFQNYGAETGSQAVPLWIQHIVPTCQQVMNELPPEALRLALLSGLVGTTSVLVVKECEYSKQVQSASLQLLQLLNTRQLLNTARSIVAKAGETEEWMWSNPWRSRDSFAGEEDDDIAFENNKDNIAWWNQAAHRHEKVAGMDTAWDETGISLLAIMAFDDRPLTLTPTYTWNTWFPHVATLFKASTEFPYLENLPVLLLEKLFEVVPEKSLPTVSSASKKADAPYETFQLLSNRIVGKPQKKGSKKSKKELELETKTRSERIVGVMKSLLNRYPSINQIKIVRKLVHDCPHPGLQAKFMDLMRPLVFDEECAEAFWSYIGSFMKDLLGHMDEGKDELFNTGDLIEKVEIYVGATTMIQLWCIRKKRLPKKIKGTPLSKFYKILKQSIATWMKDQHVMPPNDYYRLYLLEGALQQVFRILKEARQRKRGGQGDEALNDSLASLGDYESTHTHLSSYNDGDSNSKGSGSEGKGKEEEAIVGDIDIFS